MLNSSKILVTITSNTESPKYSLSLLCSVILLILLLFFSAQVEGLLRRDYLIFPHYRYYVREMRILAYTQLLESYRSLTLHYMAEAFGVTVEYIDQ